MLGFVLSYLFTILLICLELMDVWDEEGFICGRLFSLQSYKISLQYSNTASLFITTTTTDRAS